MKRKTKSTGIYRQLPALIGWVLLCEAAGIIGAVFTVSAIPGWYAGLIKPSFSPPNWVFGPVWTILYALMGIAAFRVSGSGASPLKIRSTIRFFLIHLFLNAVWSPVFFGAKNFPLAFAVIGSIWVTLIALIFMYRKIDTVSAYLLIPYLAWVSFATVLSYHLWWLNM